MIADKHHPSKDRATKKSPFERHEFAVIVTHGMTPGAMFASVPDRPTADKLCAIAKGKGYSDAQIVPWTERQSYR